MSVSYLDPRMVYLPQTAAKEDNPAKPIRLLVFLAIAGALAFCGSTVKLGERT